MNVLARKMFAFRARNVSSKTRLPKEIGLGGITLLAVPLATFCLGTWQVKRRAWKLNLIKELQQKNNSPAIEFPDDLEKLMQLEYRKVRVRGKFDFSKEMYIGPRQLITEKDTTGGSIMSSRSQTGNFVITPFHIMDKNLTILVNRGWVPKEKTNPSSRTEKLVNEEIDLVGTVRLDEKRPPFCPKQKQGTNLFNYRNVSKMAEMTGAAPIFLDADSDSTVPGGPIGGQTRISFRNEHLSYIITWYSLCAVTSYLWYSKYIRKAKLL